ncbi:unnamed protein product [Spirodela intermedia]|uniref:DYW domain-containing protein n=1 Tax=Spirodela intermedia TaxID=51605 RepID=A0A7I8IUI7_SPIIN|nr:unnamed protein product [Spirodela intermedia]CAA6661694.1 unnamed protein product [Spirodela intermedia]
MIRAYSRAGWPGCALRCFWDMLSRGVEPDKYTFPLVLRACTAAGDVAVGASVHREASRRGLDIDIYVRTALVDMYAKLGMLRTAWELFDTMPETDVVSWNAMIFGFTNCDEPRASLTLFIRMASAGLGPNSITVLSLFPAICKLSDILLCRAVHGFVVRRDWLPSVNNGLIDTYCKCGGVGAARRIFDEMPGSRDAVTWGSMISGYVSNGLFTQALELFDRLREDNAGLNQVSVVGALMAATEMRDLERGKEIHAYAGQAGIDSAVSVGTALVTMYAKCGDFQGARGLFDGIEDKDVVAWSAVISASAQTGHPRDGLSLFAEMQRRGLRPNRVTVISVLPACAQVQDKKLGKSVHGFVLRSGVGSDVSIVTALVAIYAKYGLFRWAHSLFDASPCKDVVAWNALVNGYAQRGDATNAMKTFRRMGATGLRPDAGTMVGVLPACSLLNDLPRGTSAHGLIVKSGLGSDLHVKNALVDMYAKCGDFTAAENLFRVAAGSGDDILWNTMIAGYAQNGRSKEAVSAFHQMRGENLKPNLVTYVCILPAVAYLALLWEGLTLHCGVIKVGFESHVVIGNSLIDMYSKCGRVDLAREFFDRMESKDVVSWNVMISGLAAHGLGEDAVELFSRMPENRVLPDSVSFLAVLSACRHGVCAGPNLEHYACMVDLLGRSCLLDEAWDLIRRMPMPPDAGVWGALLGACRMHSNARMGEVALKNLVRLEPQNAAHYVVLSSIYAQLGRWTDARSVKNVIHAFRVGDRSHPQYKSMSGLWDDLRKRMEGVGYVPDTSAVLLNVVEEEKTSFLHGHSERLAISFALLNTEPGLTIHVVKNLRVCGDCHTVTKLISKITNCRIIVRDSSRFHHFENGACSCHDYW